MTTPLRTGAVAWRRWGSGPHLVMLHGGAGSWRHWARNIPALSQTHTVHVPDLPGLGDSDDIRIPVTDGLIGWAISEGIETLLPDRAPFDLVGFSFGAVVAGHVALAMKERLRSLTLVGAGALGLRRATIKMSKWRDEMDAGKVRDIHRKNLASLMIADPAHIDQLAVTIQQENGRRARLKSRSFTPQDALAKNLHALNCTNLHVIYGAKDAVVGPYMQERSALFKALLPVEHFMIIPDAGHWVAYEQPVAFNALLKRIVGY